MDELWQRYRTFWTPLLIGLGVFMVGVIAVHIITDDPAEEKVRYDKAVKRLKRMQKPDRALEVAYRERSERFQADNKSWSERLNQTGGSTSDIVVEAAAQALRASLLRGASKSQAASASALAPRFGDDTVAADLAIKRYDRMLVEHSQLLRTGDPNVAGSRLLDDVWTELRVRANRADVELASDQLGFGAIASVTRATLPGRVLNLALAARVVDCAIRNEMESVDAIRMPTQIEPGNPGDFITEWPVTFVLTGAAPAIKRVVDLLTDETTPVPIYETSRMARPRKGRGQDGGAGLIEFTVTATSIVVRPDVALGLDVEENEE